ncbi:peptidase inhibitor family I36 protein [Streptomyces cavernicola]|uniref:Peptidase inhibitor family I36 protein n=1 Tax=Streptomyces cavernicola TaxID=3043613 RepID=A0ABT6S7W5_9ACTN|nr:peptidase inhibitor family I36 protein [Streptomyces sp. B-S-A6]MDI3404187.1 peptidase inhibitor family I36 protein [Streptomyces sp. B-S-A6]
MTAAAGLLALGMATAAQATNSDTTARFEVQGKSSCPDGYVCVWNNNSFSGKPKWKSKGNLNRDVFSADGISILNNGTRYPGADHIYYKYTYQPGGKEVSGCLHYPGSTPNSKKTYTGVVLNYAQWGGEC